MRGLDVRVSYALAKIAVIAGTPDAAEQLEKAEDAAVWEGYRDYKDRVPNAPIMFSDVPELVRAWNSGQDIGVHEDWEKYHCHDEYDLY